MEMILIKTLSIDVIKFKNITLGYALIEGEGDKSPDSWKKVHWVYYANKMIDYRESPSDEMEIVCEQLNCIWPDT